jgi:predicted SnoaL-like aldol condensation-catalyzing enzyme
VSNPKRKHHITPAFYLRGFTSPEQGKESFIWVYERGLPYRPGYMKKGFYNPCQRPVTATGFKWDYYAFEKPDGSGWDYATYENALEKIEVAAKPAIQRLRRHELVEGDDRTAMAIYITVMMKRVPRRREWADEKWPDFIREFEEGAKVFEQLDAHERDTDPSNTKRLANIARMRAEYTGLMDQYKSADSIPRHILLPILTSQKSKIPPALCDMTWRLLVSDNNDFFLTSDNPLWFDEEQGIRNQRLEVSFPISSDAALVLSRRAVAEGVFGAGRHVVEEVNRRSATRATRYLYGRQPEP